MLQPAAESAAAAQSESARLRVATFPARNLGNPYIEMFYGGLRAHGVEHVGGFENDLAWLRQHADQVDVLHVHWPERLWRGRPKGRADRLTRLITAADARAVWRLERFLREAGLRGLRRLWTVHNLEHHEGAGGIDRWGYRTLGENCDVLITHSRCAGAEVRRVFPAAKEVISIHHGIYADAYPSPRRRAEVLCKFGLDPDRPVVGCIGVLRRYKGIGLACEAGRLLGNRAQLLVAGRPKPASDAGYWREMVAGVPGAVLIDRNLTDQEFADLVSASDVILQSYKKITGSGLLFAAWTFEKGVVASDLPFFREMLEDFPDAGRLFRAGDAADLARAIEEYLAIPEEQRRAAVWEAAAAHSWDRVIEPVAEVFRRWQEEKAPAEKVST